MDVKEVEEFIDALIGKYKVEPEIKVLESSEMDKIDERIRSSIGYPTEPRTIADSSLDKPRILIEKSAFNFFDKKELLGKIAHEYFHILARKLNYKQPILKVYRKYKEALPFAPYPQLLDLCSCNLWESCSDQLVISDGLKENLYALRKRQLENLLKISWQTRPRTYLQNFVTIFWDCYVPASFHLFQLANEEKYLCDLLIKLKRLQGVKEDFIKTYDRFVDCVTLKNPPTEEGVRGCFEKLLDLFEVSYV